MKGRGQACSNHGTQEERKILVRKLEKEFEDLALQEIRWEDEDWIQLVIRSSSGLF
jgi:hypothetical protein